MKASEKLRAAAGANIAESMGRPAPVASPAVSAPHFTRTDGQERYSGLNRVKGAFQVPVGRIAPDPNQPRKEFDGASLGELAESLRTRGLLQPIRVRWSADADQWVIIAGERRWRAAVLAGLATVAAVESPPGRTDDEVLEDQLVENCVREDLKPVEQARAFKALIDARGWSADRLAKALNLNESSVIRALHLLDLPGAVQDRVDSGQIAPSVAYEVSKLDDPAAQAELAERVVAEGLNRAEVIEARRSASGKTAKGRAAGKAKKVTSRKFTKAAGCTVTFDNPRGLDAGVIRAALAEVLARIDAESGAA